LIIDLERFLREERGTWKELERLLDKLQGEPLYRPSLEEAKRLHYLYQRTSADLAKVRNFSHEPDLRRHLENLVGRAYTEIHETRSRPHRLAPFHWLLATFPQTFRRHFNAFLLSLGVTMAGSLFGTGAILFDPASKEALMPFPHLLQDPSDRVEQEEAADEDALQGSKASFAAFLMRHNTRISLLTMALGMTWGVGTLLVLFTNGVMLGAVATDYVVAGESVFLMGWLLPHGVVEIPAILLAGQAGFVLARALIGWGDRATLRIRMRAISNDLVHLIFGIALLLVWAGIIESFLSQYHEPIIPYAAKILLGMVELVLLGLWLGWCGRGKEPSHA